MFGILARNVVWSWIGFVIHSAIVLLLTPYVLEKLGGTHFAIWTLATAISGYYGLFDLGLRGGLTQYLTRYWARKDWENLNRTASTMFFLLVVVGIIIGLVSLILGWWAPALFRLPTDVARQEVFACIVIIGFGVIWQFIGFPFMTLLTATQRFDIINGVSTGSRLIAALATYWILHKGGGIVEVAVATTAGNLIDIGLRAFLGARMVPELKIAWRYFHWESCREAMSYGIWTFAISVSEPIVASTSLLIVGLYLPLAGVNFFSFANGMAQRLHELLFTSARVFFPAATDLHARGELDQLRHMYISGTRLLLLVVAVLAVISGTWAGAFFELWLGKSFVKDTPFMPVPHIYQLLLVPLALTHVGSIGRQVLLGSKRVQPVAVVTVTEIITTVALGLLLVPRIGLAGIALAPLIPCLIGRAIVVPRLLQEQLKLSARDFYRQTLPRPALVAIVLAMISQIVIRTHYPTSWLALVSHGALALAAGGALVLVVGIRGEERQTLLDRLRRRVRPAMVHPLG